MDGVSLSELGLRVVGGRLCPDGEPHEVSTALLSVAKGEGSAEGRCQRCKQWIKVVKQ